MDGFDYSQGKFWIDLLQLVGLVALGIYTHITHRSKANSQAIEEVRNHVISIERRVDVLENRQAQAPTHGDLAILHKRVTNATETMERLAGEFQATNRQLGLIHEHLLNDKRGD
ncbi:DUF2730 family protein [Halomonas eurihalina]|uniref:DUF2730 family protein n=1 Tax=Halomonas eurihalina TaxID=42566 RepID=A0A5D9DD94_HALER|nr:DUF2730 family protein [Halomonas eurihalina]MDR5857937.1 DUF2730 family protein [Halomonas eurihalina]TZG41549.1 DUF2730 family protein [Halomonas eurihalina]